MPIVVGVSKVCLLAAMSIGLTRRSPLPGLTKSPVVASRRTPAGDRRFGEMGFLVEGGVDRRADERHARKAGQHGAEKPPHGDAAMLYGAVFLAVGLDRRRKAQIGSLGAPVAAAMELIWANRHVRP